MVNLMNSNDKPAKGACQNLPASGKQTGKDEQSFRFTRNRSKMGTLLPLGFHHCHCVGTRSSLDRMRSDSATVTAY